jgi:Na+-transporting NADH:ubiquinone oxidoreductase subunit C
MHGCSGTYPGIPLRTRERTWTVFERITAGDQADEAAEIGFIFQGQGVWDLIRGIIVLSPDLTTVAASVS